MWERVKIKFSIFQMQLLSLPRMFYKAVDPHTSYRVNNQIQSVHNLQKYGLKVYLRDPNAYTPLLEPATIKGQKVSSLTLGRDPQMTKEQIAQFSQKDAEVFCLFACYPCKRRMRYWFDNIRPSFCPYGAISKARLD